MAWDGMDDYYAQLPACKMCGAYVRYVDADLRTMTSGYYECPHCGWAGNEYVAYGEVA